MGSIDIAALHPIYRQCIFLTKENKYPFIFKEDTGNYETMIEFSLLGPIHPPISKDWDEMKKIQAIPICPDIMDFESKIILEYEEESTAGKSSGKMGKKGHFAESKRDERRDKLYKENNFRFCKIWESEVKSGVWVVKLFHFLSDCFSKRDTEMYLNLYKEKDEFLKEWMIRSN